VLSSDFVQRGEPALLDKWTRAQTAVACGADLVLELPSVFSCHNAGVFAGAAVDTLASAGVVTHISFGVESADWDMHKVISILTEEPRAFKRLLKEYLKKGCSFVESRALALEKMLPGSAERLHGSNNTLALSYMLRIKQKDWNLTPVPVQREGSDYNDTELAELSSAAAIRTALTEGRTYEALSSIPPASAASISDAVRTGRACVNHDKLWDLLRTLLLRSSPEELAKYAEIGEGIEYRLKEAALCAQSFAEWTDACTSKRYPAGRIRRHGMHILLGLGHWQNRAFQRLGPCVHKTAGHERHWARAAARNEKHGDFASHSKMRCRLRNLVLCDQHHGL
jgi:predicted nucleotidyltransferase